MIDEGVGSHTFLIPPLYSTRIRVFLQLEICFVGGVNGVVECLQVFKQSGFHSLSWSGAVKDVLRIHHRAGLPRQGVANQLGHMDASEVG